MREQIELRIIATDNHDPETGNGVLHLTIGDTQSNLRRTTPKGRKKELGYVIGCVGGGVEIHDNKTKRTFFIGPKELWEAYEQATRKARVRK